MKIVNLYRKQAMEVFPNLSFVKFQFYQTPNKDKDAGYIYAPYVANLDSWYKERSRLSRELKQFLKETGVSYAWTNSPSADYSSLITVVIVNPEDYSLIKLMADEYEISNTYMLPQNLSSFSFRLTDEDYEKYKDAISKVKR